MLLVAIACGLTSSTGYSLWKDSPFTIQKIQERFKTVSLSANDDVNHVFSLFKKGQIDFQSAMGKVIQNSLQNQSIKLQSTQSNGMNLTGSSPYESLDYEFKANGIPLCNYQVRAHAMFDKTTVVLGKIPVIKTNYHTPLEDWPNLEESLYTAKNWLEENNITENKTQIIHKERCYLVKDSELLPVWNITLNTNSLGYKFYVDEYQVERFENQYFHIQGKVRAYDSNPKNGALKTYNVELEGKDETLTNSIMFTDPVDTDRAKASDYNFEFDPKEIEFAEASVFTHAAFMYTHFNSLGFKWSGPKLKLKMHVDFGGNVNNALYQPASSTTGGFPTISIGDGDGRILTNLALDSDVVSHELGHHIIYRKLTTISGESLVLHEGLADFFTFSKTKDSCLGESICPESSTVCWKKSQCLRSADNTLKYQDARYNHLEPHLKGQVISGLLWDLYTDYDVPLKDVGQLAYNSIDYFVKNSGIKDFIISLFLADKTYMDSKYTCKIYQAAQSRGMGDLLSGVSCENPDTWQITGAKLAAGSSSSKTKSSTGGLFSCATIQNTRNVSEKTQSKVIFIVLTLPLLIVWIRRKRYHFE